MICPITGLEYEFTTTLSADSKTGVVTASTDWKLRDTIKNHLIATVLAKAHDGLVGQKFVDHKECITKNDDGTWTYHLQTYDSPEGDDWIHQKFKFQSGRYATGFIKPESVELVGDQWSTHQ